MSMEIVASFTGNCIMKIHEILIGNIKGASGLNQMLLDYCAVHLLTTVASICILLHS